ncbi:eclosion hormone-like [Schistocerca serialis cubense]|uniref:eclosion hormone-like n=1 Tax=Schistocerca serialis cubense TaxID=2023355 RepID=UPI00214EB452|nr:eclosion hormone-like [Schistocerca serialis cubense]
MAARRCCPLATLLAVLLVTSCLAPPADANVVSVCIRNCAQCKKMYGPYFEGQLCADACLKFNGKMMPDCEDAASIAPFLNKLE